MVQNLSWNICSFSSIQKVTIHLCFPKAVIRPCSLSVSLSVPYFSDIHLVFLPYVLFHWDMLTNVICSSHFSSFVI
jgi:hypothetical protein